MLATSAGRARPNFHDRRWTVEVRGTRDGKGWIIGCNTSERPKVQTLDLLDKLYLDTAF
jgi:hypothetical protein